MAPRVLVIDNYDSFVYILVQYLGELGATPVVRRHDAIDIEQIVDFAPDGILISPGPGTPDDAGISLSAIERFNGEVPILGVCLGVQCIGQAFGATVVRSPAGVMHGKTSAITHDSTGIFAGVPSPFEATRYHSLVVDKASVPDSLTITAETSDGLVMGLRHRDTPTEGVQFHPESILTAGGKSMIANFLAQL